MNREWLDKDFYQILEVAADASPEDIKRAYRKLAQRFHPDANPGDASAEERFKRISEAYATLSDPEERKEYDQVRRLAASGAFARGGQGGFGGFGGGQRVRVEDLSDLLGGGGGLGDLFGGRGGGGARFRGNDATADLTLSFEEAVAGVTTTVPVRGQVACSRCHGSGAEPGTTPLTCPTCKGSGAVAQNQGLFSFSQPCPQCRGAGVLIESPCSACRGSGVEVRTRSIKAKIPPGVKDGATIRLPGRGGPGRNGGPPGDLLVRANIAPHRLFGRSGDDLTVTVPISYTEAALGTKVDVPTLDGPVKVRVPPGTSSGKVFRLRGKGVKPERGRGGDLLARMEILVPQKVSKDEKKLLEQLASLGSEDIRSHLDHATT